MSVACERKFVAVGATAYFADHLDAGLLQVELVLLRLVHAGGDVLVEDRPLRDAAGLLEVAAGPCPGRCRRRAWGPSGSGVKLNLATRCAGRWWRRRRRRCSSASRIGAPPSSTTLRLPAKAITWPTSLSVSERLVAAWKRSSACTRVSLRPHTPPAAVHVREVGLHPVHRRSGRSPGTRPVSWLTFPTFTSVGRDAGRRGAPGRAAGAGPAGGAAAGGPAGRAGPAGRHPWCRPSCPRRRRPCSPSSPAATPSVALSDPAEPPPTAVTGGRDRLLALLIAEPGPARGGAEQTQRRRAGPLRSRGRRCRRRCRAVTPSGPPGMCPRRLWNAPPTNLTLYQIRW